MAKVLIVHDEISTSTKLLEMFKDKKCKYTVIGVVGSGKRTLKLLEYRGTEKVICEIDYSVMSGLELVDCFNKYFSESQTTNGVLHLAFSQTEERIEEVKAFITKNYMDPNLSLGSVASYFYLSPSYLSDRFSKIVGMNLSKYLLNVRISNARVLLSNTSKFVSEISKETGYTNPTYFSTIFKREVGMTPSGYRNYKHITSSLG